MREVSLLVHHLTWLV